MIDARNSRRALASVRPYLPGGTELAGTLGGSVRAKGPASDLEEISAQPELRDGQVALQDLVVGGPVALKADDRSPNRPADGSFTRPDTRPCS